MKKGIQRIAAVARALAHRLFARFFATRERPAGASFADLMRQFF